MASLDCRVVPHVAVRVEQPGHQGQPLRASEPEHPVRHALGVRRAAQAVELEVAGQSRRAPGPQPKAVRAEGEVQAEQLLGHPPDLLHQHLVGAVDGDRRWSCSRRSASGSRHPGNTPKNQHRSSLVTPSGRARPRGRPEGGAWPPVARSRGRRWRWPPGHPRPSPRPAPTARRSRACPARPTLVAQREEGVVARGADHPAACGDLEDLLLARWSAGHHRRHLDLPGALVQGEDLVAGAQLLDRPACRWSSKPASNRGRHSYCAVTPDRYLRSASGIPSFS